MTQADADAGSDDLPASSAGTQANIAHRERGWKGSDSSDSARRNTKTLSNKSESTPTGALCLPEVLWWFFFDSRWLTSPEPADLFRADP